MKILDKNVRIAHDEIDLIARDKKTLVFVEVKTRANELYGRPVDAVDRAKRNKLSRAAIRFIKKKKLRPPYIRFDVVEVCGNPPEIRHLKNVFPLQDGYQIRW